MKSIPKPLLLVAVLALSLPLAGDADAQRIRTYGNSANGTTSGSAAQTQTSSTQFGASAGEAQVVGSYQIGIYGERERANQEARQRLGALERTELYRGVIPGERDEVDHIDVSPDGAANPLTWVGFQPEESRTRVFFQAPRTLQYQISTDQESGDLVVTFTNARIMERNFGRLIDTSFFGRAVTRIEVREHRGNVEVRLARRGNFAPEVSVDGQYLYLDFPYAPE